MKITDLLVKERVSLNRELSGKDEVIDLLIDSMISSGAVQDKETFKKAILAREADGTTAIGLGIAVPHCKSEAAKEPALAALTLKKGIDYDTPDDQPADLFFMIASPPDGDAHVEVLAGLMTLIADENFAPALRKASSPEEFLEIIDKAESQKKAEKEAEAAAEAKAAEGASLEKEGGDLPSTPKGPYKILAVTACPTGIAHTYLAAEALEKAGKKLGVPMKVETNGSGGIQNPLTQSDIDGADGIIVAADKKVETARFDGKKVLFTKVADGIHKPEELIEKALKGEAPVYKEAGGGGGAGEEEKLSVGRKIYKDLMNGVSNMLPFVIGGGILIALSFLLDDYSINESSFGSNTPLAAFFNKVGGAAFGFMLPVLAGYIAYSIADRPGLAAGFVGGALAVSGNSFVNISGEGAVSGGFLAALFAGFAAGYIVLLLKKLTDFFPPSLRGIKPTLIFPLFGVFLIGVAMFAINPIMGLINTWLANALNGMGSSSKVILGLVLGGMMSTDMGGPINKAAYVFGTASISMQNYDIMAAVMIGGMTPPIAIALLATFFKSRLTPDERKAAFVNYIMGLCFITEGAIPYAAADPLRVIPSCIVGSAVAGALSMAFDCTLMAPHGGIFVFPVVGNWGYYLMALAVGSLVSMFLLAFLKKDLSKA
jgi:PTS system fructose-specific IIC component